MSGSSEVPIPMYVVSFNHFFTTGVNLSIYDLTINMFTREKSLGLLKEFKDNN